ncbi:hypothetical protein J4N02_09810 [Propioniciclava sp. MC1595]|uniref:hypothetical protein n=1 Tax=Propioniciclava sp. MC1595 TaxID=2760308 RepID=UPI0016624E21|nr:hypothetical protein [Propioniciclava sp. MC1595]MBB1496298.1 hypothetical protein [Propioniciclava sp. MC1595]QTE24868.1 hypothetical protein J4N02_09810 [Propioniciclava sp. MC1595]
MDPNVLHLVVAAVLTVVFVVITALVWSRAQVKTVFWWIGLSLLPMGLYLLGLAPAVVGAYETLRDWAYALQLTPVAWVGIALAGLSALLMLGSRLIPSESYRDRRAAQKEKKAKAAASGSARPQVGSGTPSRPAAQAPAPRPASQPRPAASKGTSGDAEMDEITELLRKRGIN